MSNTYNGWTNYATWRINLEYGFNDGGFEGYTPDMLQEIVEQHMDEQASGTALDYANAFISNVNWYEIAEMIEEATE